MANCIVAFLAAVRSLVPKEKQAFADAHTAAILGGRERPPPTVPWRFFYQVFCMPCCATYVRLDLQKFALADEQMVGLLHVPWSDSPLTVSWRQAANHGSSMYSLWSAMKPLIINEAFAHQ